MATCWSTRLPGLAKTRLIKAMVKNLECDLSRIQSMPGLLRADVTGTEVYHPTTEGAEFRFDPGPIFANLVLADEINRAPAKVRSAVLEAMEERRGASSTAGSLIGPRSGVCCGYLPAGGRGS